MITKAGIVLAQDSEFSIDFGVVGKDVIIEDHRKDRSFKSALMQTTEWELWADHARRNHLYDSDESEELGMMSVEHARAFLDFVRTNTGRVMGMIDPREEKTDCGCVVHIVPNTSCDVHNRRDKA